MKINYKIGFCFYYDAEEKDLKLAASSSMFSMSN